MSWEDDEFDFGGPVVSEEEDEALAPPKPAAVPKPVPAKAQKVKGKKLREIKAEQKRLKQEKIDAEMKAQRQREREIRLKLGQNASQRDIQNALADENSLREVQDLFGNTMGLGADDDDEEEDYGVSKEAAAALAGPKASKGGGMTLADEAAQFNGPVEHALAVLKIIGVSEHEEFGEKLGDKLVEDNNIENAVGLLSALAKALKPLLSSKEYSDLAKVANVLRNDKMAEEKLARGKKKKKNKKPKVQTIRDDDIATMAAGDYYEEDTYYDQYW